MRFLILCMLVVFGAGPLHAESCVSPPQAADVQQAVAKFPPRDRGVLWRAEKDGRTSWLYGTIHVGKLEWIAPGPTIMRALRASDAVALELDLSNPGELRAMTPPVDRAAAGRVLAGGLGDRLNAQLHKACVPEAAAAALRPAMQAITLVGAAGRAEGLHPELGIDLILNGMAPRLGKPVIALETVKEQLAALLPESEADEREMVADVLDDLESHRSDAVLERLAAAWERGDAGEIAGYLAWCDCMKTPLERRMMKRLLDDRNGPMARKLALHDGGKTFFAAVGSLHMTGDQSLVALLRRRGFDVQSVAFNAQEK